MAKKYYPIYSRKLLEFAIYSYLDDKDDNFFSMEKCINIFGNIQEWKIYPEILNVSKSIDEESYFIPNKDFLENKINKWKKIFRSRYEMFEPSPEDYIFSSSFDFELDD